MATIMNWSYVAGFFDGEGSLVHNGRGFRVAITQTDFEVLSAIKKFAGVGNVVEITKRKSHWKDCWVYYIAKQKDVFFFLGHISKYVVVKRGKCREAEKLLSAYLREKEKHHSLMDDRIEMAKKLRHAGFSYRAIGERIHLDWSYVRRILLREGVERK